MINVRSPETVNELIAHYTKHELTTERKAFSTVEAHRVYIDNATKLDRKSVTHQRKLQIPPLRFAPVGMTNSRVAAHLGMGGCGWTA